MPKNKGKGGKNRRRGKNENESAKRELDLKEDGQEYGQVIKLLGNSRLRCHCFDGKERLCSIRGKMRKKQWINTNDIVLLGLRDFQDEKADVIQKYNPDEARRLKAQGHIPDNINIEDGGMKVEDGIVAFGNENDDDADLIENDVHEIAPQPNRYVDFSDLSDFGSETDSDDEMAGKDGTFEKYVTDNSTYAKGKNNKIDINIDDI